MDDNRGIHFIVLSPNKKILDEKGVTEVYFPAEYGVLGVLPGHAPMITAVGTGVVLYSQDNIAGLLKVAGGVADVSGDTVTLMVDVGEEASFIDVDRAQRALDRAESRLAAKDLGHIDVRRAQHSKARAMARLEASRLHQQKVVPKSRKDS